MRRTPIVRIIVCLLLLAAACTETPVVDVAATRAAEVAETPTEELPDMAETAGEPTEVPAAEASIEDVAESSVIALLEKVPSDESAARYVTVVDYPRAYAQLGYEMPMDCSTISSKESAEFDQLLEVIGLIGPFISGGLGELLRAPEDYATSLGLQWCDVRVAVDSRGFSGGLLTFAGGSHFDVVTSISSMENALQSDPFWSQRMTAASNADESTTYNWESVAWDDGDQPTGWSAHPGGLGQTLTIDGRYVSLGFGVPDLAEPNFLDQQHVSDVVSQLAAEGSFAFRLYQNPNAIAGQVAAEEPGVRLRPYELLGLGITEDTAAANEMVVVLAHTSADEAAENVMRFRQIVESELSTFDQAPWSSKIAVTEIRQIDNLVVGTIDGVNGEPVLETAWTAVTLYDSLWAPE